MTKGEKRLLSELVIAHVYILHLRRSVTDLVGIACENLDDLSKLAGHDYSSVKEELHSSFVTLCRAMGPGQEVADRTESLIKMVHHVRTSAETPIEAAARLRVLRELGVDNPELEDGTFKDRPAVH